MTDVAFMALFPWDGRTAAVTSTRYIVSDCKLYGGKIKTFGSLLRDTFPVEMLLFTSTRHENVMTLVVLQGDPVAWTYSVRVSRGFIVTTDGPRILRAGRF